MSNKAEIFPLVHRKVASGDMFISGDKNLNYGQLAAAINFSRQKLADSGVTPGETVAVIAENSPQMIVLILAAISSGIVVVPLNPRLPQTKISAILEPLNCSQVVSAEKVPDIQGSIDKMQSLENLTDLTVPATDAVFRQLPAQLPATIIFTSGSSGRARAALHTFGNHYYSALGSAQNIPYQKGDRWLLSLPLYHVGGLAIVFRTLQAGATLVLPDANEPPTESLQKQNITHASLVPTQLFRLLQHNEIPNQLKAALLGGGPVSDELLQKAAERNLPVFTSYGSTEMSSQITTTRAGEPLNGAGKVLPYRAVKISESSEILVRGETLFAGYQTATGLDTARDAGGWFHSGDSGYFDQQGNLHVVGRIDNMFISGGENIYPEEIERAILEIEGVEQAVVVPVPDAEFGQRPVAFVRGLPGIVISETEWKEKLTGKLVRFKIPRRFLDWPVDESVGLKPNRLHLGQRALLLMRDERQA